MKKLKLDHQAATLVVQGKLRTTWRLYDDKDLSVNDTVALIDKVSTKPETWQNIGTATITSIVEKRLGEALKMQTIDQDLVYNLDLEQFRSYYGGNVTEDAVVKIVSFSFIPAQQLIASPKDDSSKNRHVIIYADGGSRGNPGPSASGFVILDGNSKVLVDEGVYLGITTNNQAEYRALLLALQETQRMHASQVDVFMDSLLVINQMKGIFKVKNRDLWPIHDAIQQLVKSFTKVTFTHVPRELNKLADAAVNRTLDQAIAQPRQNQ